MEDTLRIICPNCGRVLIARKTPNIENKNVACPSCKVTQKFSNYKIYDQQLKVNNDAETQLVDKTRYNDVQNRVIGKLLHISSKKFYQLKLGVNTIGRNANTSTTDIRVETDDRTMSRFHAVIEVVELKNGEYKHYFSNANNKNATFVNGHKVENRDKLILNDGEEVKMANVVFKFIAVEEKKAAGNSIDQRKCSTSED